MPTAAILGVSGYSGQETLDRVLRHPDLDVLALGSDSLAGESAGALDVRLNGSLPRFVPNDEALAAGAEVVLLDNMAPTQVEVAAARAHGRGVLVEVSGGITLATIADYARAGADLISVGALTHSAPAVDIGLDVRT
jgi:nicotinate-nucleotide pyrophosphorylase (carboxylating)